MSVLHRLDRSSILVIGEYKWTILNWFPSMRRPAIEQLVKGFKEGNQFETLLGVTGSGKTFTMGNEGIFPGKCGRILCVLLRYHQIFSFV